MSGIAVVIYCVGLHIPGFVFVLIWKVQYYNDDGDGDDDDDGGGGDDDGGDDGDN